MAILTVNELVIISILREIQIELLTEKARIQRNGRALEEENLEDEPEKADFIADKSIEGTVTFDQLIEQQLNEPTPIELLTHAAEKLDAEPPAQDERRSSEKTANEESSSKDPDEASDKKAAKKSKPSRITRINAWRTARAAWRIKKNKLEYEHDRTKADVVNMCYGIDFALKIIDREIDRQKNGQAPKVDTPPAREYIE